MGKFYGILICTDLDGTLLRKDKSISHENVEAIEYFKSEGGFFTFVTGRMPFFVSDIRDTVKPNVPIGCVNGGGLYDFEAEDYIWENVLPRGAVELIAAVDEALPKIGFHINTFRQTYFCKENRVMEAFRKITGAENIVRRYDEIDEPFAKVVFGCENECELEALKKILHSHPKADEFDFVRSERTLYEILPKGSGKGVSITKLCEILGIDKEKTIALGDYDNDISMFYAAKVGIAVSNACQNALDAADRITVSNEQHAIAKVISELDAGMLI